MSSLNPTDSKWRSSSSYLLGVYSLIIFLWGCMAALLVYWRVHVYLDGLARETTQQRAQIFLHIPIEELDTSLDEHYRLDARSLNHYGLFDSDGQPIAGRLKAIPNGLPADGQVHVVRCISTLPNETTIDHCHALAIKLADGRLLVLARDNRNSSLSDISHIVLSAIAWGSLPMSALGFLGWYYLRYKPIQRIKEIDERCQKIVSGDLKQRLPITNNRDELDMLCGIVNTTLNHIEHLMAEVKSVSDCIAHDLRTPFTRLRAHLYRIRQQAGTDTSKTAPLDQVLDDVDSILSRFRALLRISELETQGKRSQFAKINAPSLFREIFEFYAPAAEDRQQHLTLDIEPGCESIHILGDRELLFEALGNITDNALKFTPEGGTIQLHLRLKGNTLRFEVHDSGSGIPKQERKLVLQRFHRGSDHTYTKGYGMGLSIVAAVVNLHGFRLEIDDSPLHGVSVSLACTVLDESAWRHTPTDRRCLATT
ncbi:two-component sensor histidine kinase [Pseudoxanthomonas kalamensis DSM 18571]|uniref:sensor histidine kinase n=1 Tax=Pseudoxanthomonas kalamensis TaxID=289483 RepID=UPI001390E09E|nr:HAMP domain-containing sensor histidine kinase [Pseudoxanthomonas kalamensis]KAF1710311.1 two-component sensor histidine kinase [Pseudoxanthomonas kalamensis DSM 18571]